MVRDRRCWLLDPSSNPYMKTVRADLMGPCSGDDPDKEDPDVTESDADVYQFK